MFMDLHLRRSLKLADELGHNDLVDAYLINAKQLSNAHRACEDSYRRLHREAQQSGVEPDVWRRLVHIET